MNRCFLTDMIFLVFKNLFCFCIIIFGVNRAYAELVLSNDINKKIIADSDQNINRKMLRDPTKPLYDLSRSPVMAKPLILQAIFIRSNSRSAVINGEHVKAGDVIFSHKIIAIDTKTVSLEKENKKITLNLRDVGP